MGIRGKELDKVVQTRAKGLISAMTLRRPS